MMASIVCQLYWLSADPVHAYYGTDSRLYQLLAGAMVAVLLRRIGSARQPSALSILGLLVMLLSASGLVGLSPTWRGFLATAAAVILLLGLMSNETSPMARLFALPIPAYLGKISYGTYLWHWPVLLVIGAVLAVRPPVAAILGAAVSTGLAALSYHAFEMPIRRREWSLRIQWPVVATGLATSALVAFLLVPPMLQSARRPVPAITSTVDLGGPALSVDDGRSAPSVDDGRSAAPKVRVPSSIDWAEVAQDHGLPHSCTRPRTVTS